MNHIPIDAAKTVGGSAFAFASWAGGQLAQVTDFPELIKAADTPLIIGGLSYAIFHLVKALRTVYSELKETNLARIKDRDGFITVLRDDAEKAAASQEKLVEATTKQTETLEALRRTVEENRDHQVRALLQEPPNRK